MSKTEENDIVATSATVVSCGGAEQGTVAETSVTLLVWNLLWRSGVVEKTMRSKKIAMQKTLKLIKKAAPDAEIPVADL
ncbi:MULTISPECIES: hypothetical protein [unclassified Bradyrhizobium]|uniref:hypothetical protein n=1 Tax=unclassified Bradyrhizobium TaxID=2631580 RepID=UPI003D19D2F9